MQKSGFNHNPPSPHFSILRPKIECLQSSYYKQHLLHLRLVNIIHQRQKRHNNACLFLKPTGLGEDSSTERISLLGA